MFLFSLITIRVAIGVTSVAAVTAVGLLSEHIVPTSQLSPLSVRLSPPQCDTCDTPLSPLSLSPLLLQLSHCHHCHHQRSSVHFGVGGVGGVDTPLPSTPPFARVCGRSLTLFAGCLIPSPPNPTQKALRVRYPKSFALVIP